MLKEGNQFHNWHYVLLGDYLSQGFLLLLEGDWLKEMTRGVKVGNDLTLILVTLASDQAPVKNPTCNSR